MTKPTYELPTLAELHQAPEVAYKNDQLSLLLHQAPHKSWVKKHPTITTKNENGQWTALEYLPIDKIEYMLTRIFQRWKVEIIDYKVMFHSVGVHVRLHYQNPVTGEWLSQDGLGAVVMQNDSGAKASNMEAIKSNSVQIGLPAAESYAIKDAAEKIGRIFGKDLNRHHTVATFSGSYNKPEQETQQEQPPETKTTQPTQPTQEEELPL